MANIKRFDEAKVLDQILKYFWEVGYSDARVDQISAITGLTKTSLYNAFGNKQALFKAATNLYISSQSQNMIGVFDPNRPLTETLNQVFGHYIAQNQTPSSTSGCLITNHIVSLKNTEPQLYQFVMDHYDNIIAFLKQFFDDYLAKNTLKVDLNSEDLTQLFMTFRQGLMVQTRNGKPAESLRQAVKAFIALIGASEYDAKN